MSAWLNLAALRRQIRRRSRVDVVVTIDPKAKDAGVKIDSRNVAVHVEEDESTDHNVETAISTVDFAPSLWTLKSGLDLHGLPNQQHYTYRLISAKGNFLELRFDGDEGGLSVMPPVLRPIAGTVSFDVSGDTPAVAHAKWSIAKDIIQKGREDMSRAIYGDLEKDSDVYLLEYQDLLELETCCEHDQRSCAHTRAIWEHDNLDHARTTCIVAKLQNQGNDDDMFGFIVRVGDYTHGLLVNLTTKALRVEKWAKAVDDEWTRDQRSFSIGVIAMLPKDLVWEETQLGELRETESGVWEIIEAEGDGVVVTSSDTA